MGYLDNITALHNVYYEACIIYATVIRYVIQVFLTIQNTCGIMKIKKAIERG